MELEFATVRSGWDGVTSDHGAFGTFYAVLLHERFIWALRCVTLIPPNRYGYLDTLACWRMFLQV